MQDSQYENFFGVKTHENGLFLYRSTEIDSVIKSRFMDYFLLFGFTAWITNIQPLFFVSFIYFGLSTPRRLAIQKFFTFHAELLPHTEQIVFHKVGGTGAVKRIYVDIKNLEKIDADLVPSNIIKIINANNYFRQAFVGDESVRH